MSLVPFYDDGQVTLYCADFHAVEVEAHGVAAVVTSPPYNVGLDYHEGTTRWTGPPIGADL
jgi:DNA modification methylase